MEEAIVSDNADNQHVHQYGMRALFLHRASGALEQLYDEIDQAGLAGLDWKERAQIAIDEGAWQAIEAQKIAPHKVFCHPEVLAARPHLTLYYRCLAALPGKGVQRLAFGVAPLESRERDTMDLLRAATLAQLFNTHISAALHSQVDATLQRLRLTAAMQYGASMNGAWRNQIGQEGERRVQALIIRRLESEGHYSSAVARDGQVYASPELPGDLAVLAEAICSNGYKVRFGSEPDISLLTPDDTLVGAIEVKAGIDPAGALERYGAAKKSFQSALNQNAAAETVYLSSALTETVRSQISRDPSVREVFDLGDVLFTEEEREAFLKHVLWLLHLSV